MAAKSTASRKGGGKRKTASAKNTQAREHARRQMQAVVLFTVALFTLALTIISGSSFWKTLHDFIFALFGSGALLLPVSLFYIALLLTSDKIWKAKAVLVGVFVICFCGALQIFQMGEPQAEQVLDMLVECTIQGMKASSGGIAGILLGLPLLLSFGKLGAGITIVLLLFALFMLLTGGTLIGLYRAAKKPVQKISEAYAEEVAQRQERRQSAPPKAPAANSAPVKAPPEKRGRRKGGAIDIPLDGDDLPPAIPVPAAPEEKPAAEKKKSEAPIADPIPPRFDIDISLDDDFQPSESGGFSLSLADEPMQFVPAAQPSLDELVTRAATQTGKFEFHADEPRERTGDAIHELLPEPAREANLLHLNLPPDIDMVDGLEPDIAFPFPARPTAHSDSAAVSPPQRAFQVPEIPDGESDVPDIPGYDDAPPIPETSFEVPDAPAPRPVYQKPPVDLLNPSPKVDESNISEELKANAQRLMDTLASFGVQTRVVDISRGPAVTRYELQPSVGVKISKITNLADDIALNLAASGVRIEAPIPNKAAVGIEVPNKSVSAVTLREMIDSELFQRASSRLTVALGRDIAGQVTLADVAKMPHLLIAGSTGSGKSVCINSIIMSLLYRSTPEEVRFLMIDPKVVELGVYNGIPQLLVPVVTDPKKAAGALSWAVAEMMKRYQLFAEHSVRNLEGYNHLAETIEELEKLPQIVIIIDELADLMMAAPKEIEDSICRLAQLARAAGMHLIIATQRPSVDVITGVIKANIPSRIAFAVSSQVDSRTILDMAGAEKLLGRGDMLFSPPGAPKPIRVQGCFVTDDEIEAVISFIKSSGDTADYDQQIVRDIDSHVIASGKGGKNSNPEPADRDDSEDDMLLPAIECVVEAGMASTSLLQRRLKLGYARAARIVDEMERRGIVGPFEGSKPRQVLVSKERWLEMKLSQKE